MHFPDTEAPDSGVDGVRLLRPRDGVTLLLLDRPEQFNALDEAILLGLEALFDGLAGDPSTRALVLSGAGFGFCAGGDLDLIRRASEATPEWAEKFLARALRPALALHRLPQPAIAAINGPVAGAGLGLALACDIRIASPAANFSAPFVHMGLVPDMGITWLLPRAVGHEAAIEWLLAGRHVEAEEARARGLVSRLTDDPVATAVSLAATFASMPPQATQTTKALVRAAAGSGLEEAIGAEAREQARAVQASEFGERYSGWRQIVIGAER
ncbi:MAG: enoyl-CoA hydratase/isomerase family protein [Actinomycetota bacterium]|jgi:enoyl-CoA hydratase/carnithine racemase